MSRRDRARGQAGFTMAELLVIIAVVGIIMAVSMPAIWTVLRSAAMRAGGEEMVTALNGARQLAIRSNRTVCVTNDGARLQYRIGGCDVVTNAAWTGPGTDAAGNVALANTLAATGPTYCYSYLGGGITTPAGCVNNGTFTVTNTAGGTINVVVATSGRARIQ